LLIAFCCAFILQNSYRLSTNQEVRLKITFGLLLWQLFILYSLKVALR
jgi:hypothetical protein